MANTPVKPSRKKLWAIIGIAAVVIVIVASVFYIMNRPITQPAPPTGPNVTIWDGGVSCSNNGNCGYSPTNKTVTGGTTITWTNTGGKPHTVTECTTSDSASACPSGAGANTSASRAFDSNSQATIQPSQQYQYTFNLPIGTYYYYCTLHPWMRGAIAIP
jgi:plastocyanin